MIILWFFCILFTLFCCVQKGNLGLIVSVSTCLLILPCGVLTVRVLLEIALSIFGMRDTLAQKEAQKLIKPKKSKTNSSDKSSESENPETSSEESVISESLSN